MPSAPHENPTKDNLRSVFQCSNVTCSFFVVNYKKEALYDFESTKICPECGHDLEEESIDHYLQKRYGASL